MSDKAHNCPQGISMTNTLRMLYTTLKQLQNEEPGRSWMELRDLQTLMDELFVGLDDCLGMVTRELARWGQDEDLVDPE